MHRSVMSLVLTALLLTGTAPLAACQPSPPADWFRRIEGGNMAWTGDLPFPDGLLTPGYYPVVGNGYVAVEPGPFIMPYVNTWPWRDAGTVHVAGLNSGHGFGELFVPPSHRAQLPSFVGVTLPAVQGASYVPLGAAIDYQRATYFNQTVVNIPGLCENTLVEIRIYCHRARRRLVVLEIEAKPIAKDIPWTGPCRLPVLWDLQSSNASDTANADVTGWEQHTGSGGGNSSAKFVAWTAQNRIPEEPDLPPTVFSLVTSAVPGIGPAERELLFPQAGAVHRVITSYATNISGDLQASGGDDDDADATGGEETPLAAAQAAWLAAEALPPGALWQEHLAAWASVWQTAGIEVTGNSSFAAIVNSSLYDIVSSMRPDWAWSTSPGGLGTNGYNGHVFWDMETWMFPVLLVLLPDLAANAVAYRVQRLNASRQRAAANGYSGAFWAWESAVTGLDTAPWRQADLNEIHISADIPLAWQKYFYATGDVAMLQAQWPALHDTCRFWECRFTRTDSNASAPPPAGFGPQCASKDGVGNFTVRNVICPDENSGIVNDSAYTNAASAATLRWCIEAAEVLNASVPATWAEMGARPYLPLSSSLDPLGGPVHQEYTGFAGGRLINQADVALLQYPLGLDFGPELAKRDLDFWSSITDFAGMFTGDASYAAAYLALGERAAADSQLAAAWAHIEPHFHVFMEKADGTGTQHFITGSGGLLQTMVYGYAGLRIRRRGALAFDAQRPVLPPLGVTAVTLRGLHLSGAVFDLRYNSSAVCLQLQRQSPATALPLYVVVVSSGRRTPRTTEVQCMPVDAVEVTV